MTHDDKTAVMQVLFIVTMAGGIILLSQLIISSALSDGISIGIKKSIEHIRIEKENEGIKLIWR